jgi:hypothetical protein
LEQASTGGILDQVASAYVEGIAGL